MDEPAIDLTPLQNDIARKVGVCIIRLQQYEQGVKRLISTQQIGGSVTTIGDNFAKRTKEFADKTLGQVKNTLVSGFLNNAQDDEADNWGVGATEPLFRVTFHAPLSGQELQDTKDRLDSFVALRNELVHHFTERFNLQSYEDCQKALSYLDTTHAAIDKQHQELRGWVETANRATKAIKELMQAPGFDDLLVFGIVDGQPHNWPQTVVVQYLKKIEQAFAVDGWTCLAEAIKTLEENWPEHTPKKYGCSSWRHLIHESRLFDLQRRRQHGSETGQIWFRSKPKSEISPKPATVPMG
ncbi:hypothetical protein IB260_12290 [Pseudomonas sp. PDM23]|uniref:OST-HTH/LOTUS domain-containing protein n=1 Tax=unclassified Pseudomonas TaxID=196821 RepID=UPI00177ED65A|nr:MULTISPECIES: OST-HTH/LOTUS domain-containing protein [unclassified Pseudomonas]MBD9576092.1 hypothetical protein [Pseudomonas sp. PDM23]MBD9668963.1 hypothetical protein [Pseudomonas sp. PDM21]